MGFELQSTAKSSSHRHMISPASLLFFLNCLLYFQLLDEKTVHEAQFYHMKSTWGKIVLCALFSCMKSSWGGKRSWGWVTVISEGLHCVQLSVPLLADVRESIIGHCSGIPYLSPLSKQLILPPELCI